MKDLAAPLLAFALALAWVAHVSASQDASITRAHARLNK
jgi:hypothetical protein